MTFADLTPGDAVFVDANIFIYHYSPDPVLGAPCTQLLQRIQSGDLTGYTSGHAVSEVAHKMMVVEANRVLGWPDAGMANRLRRHPAEVQRLGQFRQAVEDIANRRVSVLVAPITLLVRGAEISQRLGLLANDGLIVAVMQASGLTKIASHDADFDRVPGITRYAPV